MRALDSALRPLLLPGGEVQVRLCRDWLVTQLLPWSHHASVLGSG